MHRKWIYIGFVVVGLVVVGWMARPMVLDRVAAWKVGLPMPEYEVIVDQDVMIRMPDKVRLYGDLFRPSGKGEFPVVIARTPYGKRNWRHHYQQLGRLFAGQGIAFLIQDVRGKFESGGVFYPHRDDKLDGKATIDWAVKQEWCDGKVALFGFSYLGLAAWQALAETDHGVKTILPWFSGSDPYLTWYDNGIPYLKQLLFWMGTYANASRKDLPHHLVDRVLEESNDFMKADQKIVGEPLIPYRDFLSHAKRDQFWEKLSGKSHKSVPALIETGWYDRFLGDSIADFYASEHPESRLIIGPWKHNPMDRVEGLPENADFIDQFKTAIQWCQYWMAEGKPLNLPPVSYYVMGKNEWRSSKEWPPSGTKERVFYLAGDTLSDQKGQARTLLFHPSSRVPNLGGSLLYNDGMDGPVDQGVILDRDDVIAWVSSPIESATTIVGRPVLDLHVKTALPSYDLVAKLIDQAPDGNTRFMTDGVFRFEKEGKVELVLSDIAYEIEPGHSLVLAITHSHFPSHAPNPALEGIDRGEIEFLSDSVLRVRFL